MAPMKVIFDTDPGVDDAMALALLARSADVELLGVCTVFGNGTLDTTTSNALHLAELLSLRCGVHRGAAAPLDGGPVHLPVEVHGRNALGDVPLPPHPARAESGIAASDCLVQALRRHPGEVSVLAVGPLTNLALALRAAPDVAALAREVVVMGGAFGHHGHTGNVTPHAEANIYADPQAADEVFAAAWPVSIVGLDVTHQVVMDGAYLRALREHGGGLGRFLWDISRVYQAFHHDTGVPDGFYVHDSTAVARLLVPGLFGTLRAPVLVDREGATRGRTRLAGPGEGTGRPVQTVCREVDAAALLDFYGRRMRAGEGESA
ncbi:nucleoside hydrolase [Azohydromonas lata]|uniref:nucleoside hydrolase n=1 Tax=Azohydromonas lata TaxID=45677 RepID=UPI0008373807|nr:nucleoside hydrolase [Azohydromonas lata]